MMTDEPKKRAFKVFSTATGKVYDAMLTDSQIQGKDGVLCPKTNLLAFTYNMAGAIEAAFWSASQIVEMKNRISDIDWWIEAQSAKERGELPE